MAKQMTEVEKKLRRQIANEAATSVALRDQVAELVSRLATATLERQGLVDAAVPIHKRRLVGDAALEYEMMATLAELVEEHGLEGGATVDNLRKVRRSIIERTKAKIGEQKKEVDRAALQRRIEEAVQSGLGDETEMEWQRTQAWLELQSDALGWKDGEQVIPEGWPPNCDAEDRLRAYFTDALTPKAPEPGDNDNADDGNEASLGQEPPATTEELLARLGGGR